MARPVWRTGALKPGQADRSLKDHLSPQPALRELLALYFTRHFESLLGALPNKSNFSFTIKRKSIASRKQGSLQSDPQSKGCFLLPWWPMNFTFCSVTLCGTQQLSDMGSSTAEHLNTEIKRLLESSIHIDLHLAGLCLHTYLVCMSVTIYVT